MGDLIETLFEMPRQRFLDEHWPDQPLFHAGPVARLAELVDHPALADVPAFVRAHSGPAHLVIRTPHGTSHRTLDAEAALAAFASGGVMDFRDVQRWLPPVRAWMDRLIAELDLAHAARASYCHAFLSPAGKGVHKHFDNREVIAVQIHGTKRWRVARNDLVLPLMPHNAGNPVHPLNRPVATPALDDTAMPDDAQTFDLSPGCVVFVPRGYWHATETLEDSFSLSFGFRSPSWAERFVETLQRELGSDARWRAPAYDVRAVKPPGTEEFVRAMHGALHAARAVKP